MGRIATHSKAPNQQPQKTTKLPVRRAEIFRAPMGASVIGGLLASTVLSLFVVPVIYTLFDDFEHRIKRLFGHKAQAPVAATAHDAL